MVISQTEKPNLQNQQILKQVTKTVSKSRPEPKKLAPVVEESTVVNTVPGRNFKR